MKRNRLIMLCVTLLCFAYLDISSCIFSSGNRSDIRDNDDYYNGYQNEKIFHGYECTEDCSGHEAGYDWAEENDITDVDDCDGNSNSFNEGCQAYVGENY